MAKILIVEDNAENRDVLGRRLQRKGHETLFAMDGQEGVDMARAHKPDAILMDMSLPIMDGWEASRRIRASAGLEHIPLIALTAHAMAGDREKALAAGCDDYDTKPVDFARLHEKIELLLRRGDAPVIQAGEA